MSRRICTSSDAHGTGGDVRLVPCRRVATHVVVRPGMVALPSCEQHAEEDAQGDPVHPIGHPTAQQLLAGQRDETRAP